MEDAELPRGVALAWGVAANPQRGPKRELSIERLVDAAVEIADERGLAAVSMSAVATALGVTTMALYRYVSAKDDLVLLMQERGIGVPPESIAESDDWREGLRLWAGEQARMYLDHPWLLDIEVTGTPLTPNNLAWLDAALHALRALPVDFDTKVSCVLTVIAQVRWESFVTRGFLVAAAGEDPDARDLQAVELLKQLVSADDLPLVHAALFEGAFSPQPDGNPFSFGLERVLDGIAVFLEGRSPQPPAAPDPLIEAAMRDPRAKEAIKARREAEKSLREARKREREAIRHASERLARERLGG